MHKTYFIYLAIMVISTYLIRVVPFVLIKHQIENRFIRSFLHFPSSFLSGIPDHRPALAGRKAVLFIQSVGIPGQQDPAESGKPGYDMGYQRFPQSGVPVIRIDDHVAQVPGSGVVRHDPGKPDQFPVLIGPDPEAGRVPHGLFNRFGGTPVRPVRHLQEPFRLADADSVFNDPVSHICPSPLIF